MSAARSRKPRRGATAPVRVSVLLSHRDAARPRVQSVLRRHGFREPARALAMIDRLHRNGLERRNLSRIFAHLMRCCGKSADPDRALLNFERLVAALPNPNMFYHYLDAAPDRLELLIGIFTHSQSLADTLARNAYDFHFLIAPDTLKRPREKSSMAAELNRLLMPIRVPVRKYDVIRRFRRRETLRIGARDLMGHAPLEETARELSNLADVCLDAVHDIAVEIVRAQCRLPAGGDGDGRSAKVAPADAVELGFAVIGMGKLGGQELNYSSDVDVIFVYGEDGNLTPTLTRHQFFTRLAEEIIRAVGTAGPEGAIYRIDLRLRPEGATGPLVRSLDSCENYYAQWGEVWERMALIKARPVAGDAGLGAEFLGLVQPFVYARHVGRTVFQQMAQIKDRIEKEIVGEGQLTRHVKLGIGGIREIEFIVQSLQILRGPQLPALRERNTLRALALLAGHHVLPETDAAALADAYRFLRMVEHRLQMERDLQTHTIPDEERALDRLARSLGFESVARFRSVHENHTGAVRRVYESLLAQMIDPAEPRPDDLLSTQTLPDRLARAGFADVPAAVRTVNQLMHGPGFVHISQRTKELFAQLFPAILGGAREVADPDTALVRLEKFVGAYGSRGLLYEMLAGKPKLIEMLLRLGDASRFFADTLTRRPELFDEICRGLTLSEPKDRERMRGELAAAVNAPDTEGRDAARKWKRGELLRIGIEDVMGLVDLEQLHREITALGESCLQCGLDWLDAARPANRTGPPPFAVIALGKFGGQELGYGADLDVLFVGGDRAADPEPACRRASALIGFLEQPTAAGILFQVDARLRPDGEKGPLASSLEAHEGYYRQRAQLWERQALTRVRFVAGDAALGARFVEMVHGIVYQRGLRDDEWEEIRRMRRRIETERTDPKHPEWEFKTGAGGQVDVEFLVQTLQLAHGHAHPHLRTAHTLAALNRLAALGLVDDEPSYCLRSGYLFLRKIESVLRRMDHTAVSRIPEKAVEQLHLARRMGFASAKEFFEAYGGTTRAVRAVYQRIMG